MARREVDYTVTDEGRDKGKTYHLTEMSCVQAEKWAIRTMRAMLLAGIPVSAEMIAGGIGSLANVNPALILNIDLDEVFALGEELMQCVSIKPDPMHPGLIRKNAQMVESDIEEIRTRLNLKLAVYRLIVGFSPADAPST